LTATEQLHVLIDELTDEDAEVALLILERHREPAGARVDPKLSMPEEG